MAGQTKRRFVDSHLHIWDLAVNPSWYAFPKPAEDEAKMLGWRHELPSRYMFDEHRRELASVKLAKAVHVMAVTLPSDALPETLWLDTVAEAGGLPNAIIGAIDVQHSAADILDSLDRSMASPRFRGIRLRQPLDYESDHGVTILTGLAERGLLFEVMAHPGAGLAEATAASKRHTNLGFVLEHTGWPLATLADADHFQLWRREIARFAEIETNTIKLSGLGMVYHQTCPEDFVAYWEYCLEKFGPDRCMFGSNFPVDAQYGTFDDLLAVFEAVVAPLSETDQAALFADTAERIYKI